MKKLIIALTLVIIYAFSCVGAWYDINWNYTHGRERLKPNGGDIILMFFPVVNTFASIDYFIVTINAEDFFNIK